MARGRTVKRARETSAPELVRFGISIPAALIQKFDNFLARKNIANRSEAIRELIQDRLVHEAWSEGKGEQLLTITLVYDPQHGDVQRRLQEQKKALSPHLVCAHQVRLEPKQELEMIALRGPAAAIRAEAEGLLGTKGLLHGKLVMTTAAL